MVDEARGLCKVLEAVGPDARDGQELFSYTDSLRRLLGLLVEDEEQLEVRLLAVILVVAVGHCGHHYWTNETNRLLAKELLVAVCRKYSEEDSQSLLTNRIDVLTATLEYLKGILTRDTWKQHPLHKQALVWLIRHLKHPHLAPQLPILLPPTLWMLDDHSDYHRTLALSTLTHIIHHMDPAELRGQGKADLLYQALKPLLYISSSEVIYSLHPCLLKLLPVLDYATESPAVPAQERKVDQVFSILVDQLAKEPKLSLQRAYSAQLQGYIQLLGIFSVRYTKQLLPSLLSQLEHCDPDNEQLRRSSLRTLSVFISYTWPRAPTHKFTILAALSKLVQGMSHSDREPGAEHGLLDLVVKCLTVLLEACPEVKDDYEWLKEIVNHSMMKSCLQQVLDSQADLASSRCEVGKTT